MLHQRRHDSGVSNALIGVIAGVAAVLALGAAVFVAASRNDDDSATGDVYVSLGDSVAAGNGASDADTTSYAALVAKHEDIALFNIAKAGATTREVIDTQITPVLPAVQAGRARFIAISAGGNDLAALIPNAACVEDPLPPGCPLDETLEGVRLRLQLILGYLRDANRRVPIVILAYPNFFSGTGHAFEAPASRVLPRFAAVLRELAAEYDGVAVAEPSFEGRGDELTHVLDPAFDPHPNDAGHAIIAVAVEDALREAREDLE